MKSETKIKRLLAYICVPVIFGIIGYLVLFLALEPVWETGRNAFLFMVSDAAPNFTTSITSIYDSNASAQNGLIINQGETGEDPYILISDIEYPYSGAQYARITCERIGLDAPVFWDDTDEILAYGVGQSALTFPPGFGRLLLLAGHNTTYFRCLEYIEPGDIIEYDTNYGLYEYEVTDVLIYNENDLESLLLQRINKDTEELIMYTCYPFYTISTRKTDRLTVFARPVSGIQVKWRGID